MAGFDINRIVGLDAKYAKTLECAVCLAILNNPLMTKCGHNYCNQCHKDTVGKGVKECPKCRKPFTRKRREDASDDSCVIVSCDRENFIFFKNLTLNEIIGKQKINCDYESNGCKESVELESLSDHLTRCEYRLCETCGFRPKAATDQHNCIEWLKNLSDYWKEKCEKNLQTIKELEDKLNAETNRVNHSQTIEELNNKLEEELRQKNELKQKYENQTKLVMKFRKDNMYYKHQFDNSVKQYQELEQKYSNSLILINRMNYKEKNELNNMSQSMQNNSELNISFGYNSSLLCSTESQQNNGLGKLKVTKTDVLKCIESGEVDDHLIGVYNRTIDSERCDIFLNGSKEMPNTMKRHSSKFPFIFPIYIHCLSSYYRNCRLSKIDRLKDRNLYEFFHKVWIPEAIVKAITIIYNCDWDRAQQVFDNIQ